MKFQKKSKSLSLLFNSISPNSDLIRSVASVNCAISVFSFILVAV